MKHSKVLFKHHLTVWSNFLVEATLQKNAATWLLENNARTTLFYLEAMTYVLATMHDDKKLTKLNERFKLIEDSLGTMDYYAGMINDFKGNKKIPVSIIAHLEVELQTATFKTNALLHEQAWLGKDADRMDKVKQIVRKIDWLSDDALIEKLHNVYHEKTADITAALSQPIVSIEDDLHELRRDIRWLSIYPQAFKGYITLTRPRAIVARKFNKYLTDEVVHSPYNVLTSVPDIISPVQLNANNFYAMSWFIAALGTLKDQGLRLDALTHAIHVTQKISPEAAQAQALAALGPQQAPLAEIIQAAEFAMKQIKTDGIFVGLLRTSPTKADQSA